MFVSNGKLEYHKDPLKMIVTVDQQVSDYYLSQIPKYLNVHRQRFPAHISAVRNERPKHFEVWEKYQNHLFEFEYSGIVYNDDVYYWLDVTCPKLEEIRCELGLNSTSQWTKSPDGRHRFHITIGNTKHLY